MKVEFSILQRPNQRGVLVPTEHVTICTGRDGRDEVCRVATADDRVAFAPEYARFLQASGVPEVKREVVHPPHAPEKIWKKEEPLPLTSVVVDEPEEKTKADHKHKK